MNAFHFLIGSKTNLVAYALQNAAFVLSNVALQQFIILYSRLKLLVTSRVAASSKKYKSAKKI